MVMFEDTKILKFFLYIGTVLGFIIKRRERKIYDYR